MLHRLLVRRYIIKAYGSYKYHNYQKAIDFYDKILDIDPANNLAKNSKSFISLKLFR